MAVDRTLVLIKPDGVQRGLVPDILERFQTAGLELLGLNLTYPSEDLIAQHYEEHHDKDFYPTLLDYMVDEPVIAVAYQGVEAVATARKLVGDTEPHNAAPGTIRGDHAHTTTQHANSEDKPVKNLVHAAEDHDDAERELALWFDDEDLRPVGRLDTDHIR
jgi:nucleoside-diphosphate kinase